MGASALLVAPRSRAAARDGMRVVGVLEYASRADFEEELSHFKAGLLEGGFEESRNVRFEYRFADYDHHKLERLAGELVRAKVDVIYAPITWAVYGAQAATKTIPIVFSGVNDPVHVKIVKSLSRPGGNITGISAASGELTAKRVQLMREAFPHPRDLGVVYDEDSARACDLELSQITDAGKQLGMGLRFLPYTEKADLEQAFSTAQRSNVAALLVPTTYESRRFRAELLAASSESGVPLVHADRRPVVAGGLMSYGPLFGWAARRAGIYVARILNGAKPAELPIEQPTTYELVINLKAARAMGISISPAIVLRADHVIE